MPAYAVFIREKLTDPAEFQKYSEVVGETFKGFPAKILAAYGKQEKLEGTEPDGVVIIEFPDAASARAWYVSPAYQQAAAHRWKAGPYNVVIVDGL
ncbi:hypothetical protein GOX01_02720 [Gluconobacter oxydans]|uniref:DUF1330 domain-containing protein n=1 Tax=Gluconobacter oxydans TaxID=442 RepID=A0AB35AKK3_GLUOY|nr:DUF1330 domain-containing protein [Gluconobacter oxydans]KXV30286.1 hypothetical protein AD939_11975 [Gluconobacter oxydans]MBF0855453.1 DUF1330 domain-containing protein [Gluconobacter oxydans]TCW28358.1 uncharacterized protein (DUF1330 family) [Gluconobacter oxydans]GEC59941.1 hypothetical protein GOX01_02720 [Gluconobacter oxydans]